MTEVGGVPGSYQVQVETDPSEAVSTARPAPAAVDTEVPSAVDMPLASASELPPSNGPIDYGLATSAVGTMSESVGVDFGRIAALMMMIDSELSRAARDSQVEQIEEVAAEMHTSAGDLRASAEMALVGGCVAGSMQIASAGITIGGGAKGMSLTTGSIAVEGEAPPVPLEETTTAPAEDTSAPATSPQAELDGGVKQPAPAQANTEETQQENVEETTEQDTKAKQKTSAEHLDGSGAFATVVRARAEHFAGYPGFGASFIHHRRNHQVCARLRVEDEGSQEQGRRRNGRKGARLHGTYEGIRRLDAKGCPGHDPGVPTDDGQHAPDEFAGLVASLDTSGHPHLTTRAKSSCGGVMAIAPSPRGMYPDRVRTRPPPPGRRGPCASPLAASPPRTSIPTPRRSSKRSRRRCDFRTFCGTSAVVVSITSR